MNLYREDNFNIIITRKVHSSNRVSCTGGIITHCLKLPSFKSMPDYTLLLMMELIVAYLRWVYLKPSLLCTSCGDTLGVLVMFDGIHCACIEVLSYLHAVKSTNV